MCEKTAEKISKYLSKYCGGDLDRAFEFAHGLMSGNKIGFMTVKWKLDKEALKDICNECGIEYKIKTFSQIHKDRVVVYLRRKDI